MALGTDEGVRVDDDLADVGVERRFRQVQQRQQGLGGQQEAVAVVQFQALEQGKALLGEKQHAVLAQPGVFRDGQAIEDRQALTQARPELVGDGDPRKQAPLAPGAPETQGLRLRSAPRRVGS